MGWRLIPADGFYEWQKTQGGAKQPFYFSMTGNAVFVFAGLWESWNDIETCTILTTAANSLLQPIDDRMPVILSPEDYGVIQLIVYKGYSLSKEFDFRDGIQF
jgi:putative SOS response-associated peptidase YedK